MKSPLRRLRELFEPAAVGVDGPYLVLTTSIGVKGNLLPVRRPAWSTVLVQVVGQLASAGPIRPGDEDILLLRTPRRKSQPPAVG